MRIHLSLISFFVFSNVLVSNELSRDSSSHSILNRLKKIEHDEANRRLFLAVDNSNLDEVKKLLSLGADPNTILGTNTTELRVTPYSRALVQSNPAIVDLLRKHGGNLYYIFPHSYNFSDIYSTCQKLNFDLNEAAELYAYLFNKRYDDDGKSWLCSLVIDKRYDNDQYRPVWEMLVDTCLSCLSRESFFETDIFTNSPLHYLNRRFTGKKNKFLKKMLLKCPKDETTENLLGDRIGHKGSRVFSGYHKTNCKVTLPTIDKDQLKKLPISEIVARFPKDFNFFDVGAVLKALSYDVNVAFKIFELRFHNLDKQDTMGNTLMHHVASISSHDYVCDTIVSFLQKLLEHRAKPNIKNAAGCTPLHVATLNYKKCLLEPLLKGGADPLIKVEGSGHRARDLTNKTDTKFMLAEAILKKRRATIARILENRKQWLPHAIGDLVAQFEAQELDSRTGDIKICYEE